MMHDTTIAIALALINRECSRRLTAYRADISAGRITREEANNRYLALQTAAWLLGAKGQPAIVKPHDDVLAELTRWAKELQRGATYDTVHATARDMAEIAVAIDYITALAARKGGGV